MTESAVGDALAVTAAGGAQQHPAVAHDALRNAYLVVWAHDNGSGWDVRGRVVAADGTLPGSEVPIAAGVDDERRPAVAANGAGLGSP